MKRFTMFTLRVQFAVLVALAVSVFAPIRAEAKDASFSRMIVLGDSLCDTGNFFSMTGGYPPAPYFEGRASNGRLWVEYLADALGIEIGVGDNFAIWGATTGTVNINGAVFPGLQQEVANLLSRHPAGLDPDALYVV